ncbi:Domain of unknown function DUF1983 [uncultured Caudovirales phage]|uniref:Tip attachment protein J central straight fiber domain-containing protein n=1 Tax=uncultured Caudovirales phage TaxID=2100421 RepID=A0A6J5REF1_9CAUD|nr:Domain of unknown function DUF1983 [uncultured Caudovirales phage]
MSRETLIPAIPDVTPENVQAILASVKSTLEVREGLIGDPLDQNATLRDLVDLQVLQTGGATKLSGGMSVPVMPRLPPVQAYDPNTDYTTPPAPTNLRAVGGLTNVYLEWDGAPFKNPAYAEIWRSFTDNIGSAVRIGTTAANVYADPARPDTTYYYWIRFVSVAAIVGPYNSTSGTQAKTAFVVADAIKALSADVQSSPLFIDLGSRIQAVETSQFFSQTVLDAINSASDELNAGVAANGSAIVTLQKNNATQATSITGLKTRSATSESSIVSLQQTTATQATSLLTLTTRAGASESNITSLQTTTATQASSLSTLTSTVGGNTSSLQTLAEVTNGLGGQYSVKIDNNGHVSGFGLASGAVNGSPTSAFIVRADRFSIAGANDPSNPLGTINPTSLPFMVNSVPTTVGGKTYPAGTYINTAFIANATIDSAQITSLTADQITTGSLTATIGITTGKISGGVNTGYTFGGANFGTGFYLGVDQGLYKFRVGSYAENMTWDGSALSVTGNINATSGSFRNITVYNSSNQVILSSGGISAAALANAGLGALAYKDNVTASQVGGLGNYAFLSKLSLANVSTYIDVGAISQAYIGELDASKITTGVLAAGRIDTASITISRFNSSAYMQVTNTYIKVFDTSGNIRVQIGDLNA